jgi:uncharacterized protein (TIGR02145 family)
MESFLGMNSTDLHANSWSRWSGQVGSKLSLLTDQGNNSTGFNGDLPGERFVNGSYSMRGSQGHFWSSTENTPGSTSAWRRVLRTDDVGVARVAREKTIGYPVRCVKD